MKHIKLLTALPLFTLALTGCPKDQQTDEVSVGEAREALTEATASNQAADLASASIEISTNFTIGGAVEKAADELRTFIKSQLPCAEITGSAGKLDVKYGAVAGKQCFYNGHQFSGESSVTVAKNDAGEVVVNHAWKDLSNGLVKVTGTATVTWNFEAKSRHVVHDLTWTRTSDGRTGTGKGDRVQTALGGDIRQGIVIDGNRSWEGPRGKWELDIDNVEMRWADPVPEKGKYTLLTPQKKTLALSFQRIDGDTIEVTIEAGKRSLKFRVNRVIGDIDDAS